VSNWLTIQKGVRQGCLISPDLLNCYSDQVTMESADGVIWTGVMVNNLCYADDIVITAQSPRALQTTG